ncbi:MAG: desulfoferrodoxin FeS4 iron-binding domain-containing protein [Candidatus Dadabacteria bacterium]|nr:MAG: desulfoferrodoxin FeS4 iron-binding domain-containing protein [Candidatus Dadabacteria bacterium]
MEPTRVVPVYRCPVCGAEVAVLRQGDEAPELVCCNRPMEEREAREAA